MSGTEGKSRAAVIGVGHLGRHHARLYASMPDVELVHVVDADPERAASIAGQYGAKPLATYQEIDPNSVDLVSVAVPTVDHFEVSSWLIERGIPVLVEKPMTPTVEQARALTALASKCGVCLQVGHVERFHPVVRAARRLELEPRFIEAHRLAPFSFRSTDIGVVFDLMIHDLDLVLHLVKSPLKHVHANGGAVLSSREDIATARLEFENGAVANLTASRVSLSKMRRMRVFSPRFYLTMDFDKKEAFMARKAEGFDEKMADKREVLAATPPDHLAMVAATAFRDLVSIENLELDEVEPLKAELRSFVDSVRSGERPEVPGDEALVALEAAERVLQEIKRHQW